MEFFALILAIGFAALGALVASFVGVVTERAFTGQSWARGRSKCSSCRAALAPRDLIPVLSWIALRGRCRACGSRLPATHVISETALALLFLLAYLKLGVVPALPILLAALAALAFIVLYDIRHTVVPPVASLVLAILALVFAFQTHADMQEFGVTLFAAGSMALFLFLIYALSRGRAMGLGDAPVAFSLALIAGGTLALPGLLFSFWIGALFSIGLLLARRTRPTMGIEVPFVPFLAAGFLLAYFTQWNPFPLLVL